MKIKRKSKARHIVTYQIKKHQNRMVSKTKQNKTKRIIIVGEGGKGIKFMSNILSNICLGLGYNVSLVYQYDSNVRGGFIESRIVVSKEKIDSPFFNESDFLIKLSRPKREKEYDSKIIIYESGAIRNKSKHKKLLEIHFEEISEKLFNTKKHSNLIALGKLLRCIRVINRIDEEKIKKILKKIKLNTQQIEAIKYGFNYKEILQ